MLNRACNGVSHGLTYCKLREKGVKEDGISEKDVTGLYLLEFNLDTIDIPTYFQCAEWLQIIGNWSFQVNTIFARKNSLPNLY